jgi:hypothetical protein
MYCWRLYMDYDYAVYGLRLYMDYDFRLLNLDRT